MTTPSGRDVRLPRSPSVMARRHRRRTIVPARRPGKARPCSLHDSVAGRTAGGMRHVTASVLVGHRMGRLRLPAGCPAVRSRGRRCGDIRLEACGGLQSPRHDVRAARDSAGETRPPGELHGCHGRNIPDHDWCCRQTALGCASDRLRGRSLRRCRGSATLLSGVSQFPGASVENDGKARGDQRSTRNSGLALVGRETETAEIVRRVGADRSHSDVLILTGDPGAGKSTLLGIAADSARSAGGRVLRAVGSESEAHLGFAGLHQPRYSVRRRVCRRGSAPRSARSWGSTSARRLPTRWSWVWRF